MLIENVCFVESLSKCDARGARALALGCIFGDITRVLSCGVSLGAIRGQC